MLSTAPGHLPFARSYGKLQQQSVAANALPDVISVHPTLPTASSSLQAKNACAPLTLQQYDDFELLWLEHRHGLSLGKAAALDVLKHVQTGFLPPDADLLRGRAQQFAALGRPYPHLDTQRVLNYSCQHVLECDAE